MVATVAMIAAAGVVVWKVSVAPGAAAPPRQAVPLPTTPVSLEGAPVLGRPEARVTMVLFSDFQCPFCATFANELMPRLKQEYVDSGRVKMAFRHLPLPIHAQAERAATSAACAAFQGKFWTMHDSLFRSPSKLSDSDLESHAREIGLDVQAFGRCMGSEGKLRVSADSEMARALGFTGTPVIVIGVDLKGGEVRADEIVLGVRPVKEFEEALDRALSRLDGGAA